uniref:Uncharacterized protein n=1 Tax=Arundo donax TaxID=35708 RepID=A0A0A9C920_ARUDO
MFCSWVRLSGFLTFSNLIVLLASKYGEISGAKEYFGAHVYKHNLIH